MSILCSIIIPSRDRPAGLVKAIRSLIDSAHNPSQIEILVGLDADDSKSLGKIEELTPHPQITLSISTRKPVAEIATSLIRASHGKWICCFNDDATLIGHGWDTTLGSYPGTGVILQPEHHRIGLSTYHHDARSGFPFFPRSFWDEFCCGAYDPTPLDWGVVLEALRQGWKIDFLKGVTVFHDRHA